MSITRLIATYRLTTPMFCSGADQHAAELRAASFKGVLRFWYRAIALGAHNGDVHKVHNAEAKLFGSTKEGQAKVLMSMREGENAHERMKKGAILGSGRGYLAGMGLAEPAGKEMQTIRTAIAAGARFAMHLMIKEGVTKAQRDLLVDALICIGLFGGLGARSRRGFGSLTLETLSQDGDEIWSAPQDVDALKSMVEIILSRRMCGLSTPPYTALSVNTKVVLLPANHFNPQILHEDLGRAFLHFRSYGQNVGGKRIVAGKPSLKIFEQDHHDMYDVARGDVEEWVDAPRRSAFGLPHNYYFKQDRLSVKVKGKDAKRRASPLFLHIHHCADSSPVAIVSFLPAKFLPSPWLRIWSKASGNIEAKLPKPDEFWKPIHRFLDALLQRNDDELSIKFPGAFEVKP